MKKSIFNKTCKIYNNILRKNVNYFTFALSSLHIIRAHNGFINISTRKSLNKGFFFKIKKYFRENLELSTKKKFLKNCDVILISSASTFREINNIGKPFEHLIYYLKKNNINFLVIKRNFTDKHVVMKKNAKENLILNNGRNIFLDIHYVLLLLINSLKIFFEINKKNKIEKKLINELFTFRNFSSSLFNVNHTNNIFNLIKHYNPKKVIYTYEGLPWEKLLNYKIKEYSSKIQTYGYFFSVISEFHNSPFIKFNQKYEPDIILSSGIFAKKKFLENGFKKNKVVNIGFSKKRKIGIKIKNKNLLQKNCLLIPEAFEEEIFNLVNFSLEVLKKNNSINFILRFHPSTDPKLLKKIRSYLIGKKIKLSTTSLDKDLNKSCMALYRGSSAVVKAVEENLLPVYVPVKNELSIDPLFDIRKFKPQINSPDEFILLYNNFIKNKFKYSRKNIDKIKKFCDEYFSDIQDKNISKLFRSENFTT